MAGERPGGVPPVVLDAMGGDHGLVETVPGALAACREHGVPVTLVGRAEELHRGLGRYGGLDEVGVVHADGVVPMAEGCVRTTLELVARAGIAPPERLAEVARLYTADTHGGAALLGLNGTVVVAHGSSAATAVARACVVASDLAAGSAPVSDRAATRTARPSVAR